MEPFQCLVPVTSDKYIYTQFLFPSGFNLNQGVIVKIHERTKWKSLLFTKIKSEAVEKGRKVGKGQVSVISEVMVVLFINSNTIYFPVISYYTEYIIGI